MFTKLEIIYMKDKNIENKRCQYKIENFQIKGEKVNIINCIIHDTI